MAKSDYRIFYSAWNVPTASCVPFNPQPMSQGVQVAQRDYLSGGWVVNQGLYCELVWTALEDDVQYRAIMTQLGLTTHGLTTVRRMVTLYTRDDFYSYRRYNGYLVPPALGQDVNWMYFPQGLKVLFRDLVYVGTRSMDTYCYLLEPKKLMQGTNQYTVPDEDYPVFQLTCYDHGINLNATVRPGMTLTLGSFPGWDDLGRNRVKKVVDNNTLEVAHVEKGTHDGELTVVAGSYITVYDDYRVWAKIPRFSPTYVKDGNIFHGDSNQWTPYPPPCANAGPARAGDIDPGTGKLELTFDGGNSFQFSLASSPQWVGIGPSDYAWDIADGQLMSGTPYAKTITARFPPGFRWVRLTVTSDQGNNKSHTTVVPVFARDPANDKTTPHQIQSHTVARDGQQMRLCFLTPIDRSKVPDGTLVMVWGVNQDTDKSCTFVGWHDVERSRASTLEYGHSVDTTFDCIDIAGRLKQLPAFSMRQVYFVAASMNWFQTKYPFLLYYIWYLLYWHSTALEVADFLSKPLHMFERFIELQSDAGTIYDQAHTLMQRVTPDHMLNCTRKGQMVAVADPILMAVAARVNVPVFGELNADDWKQFDVTWNRTPRVLEIRGGAILSADTYVIVDEEPTIPKAFCIAPGYGRGQGSQVINSTEHLATSPHELEVNEGNRYARLNSPWGVVQVTIPLWRLPANYEPALQGFIEIYGWVDPTHPTSKPPRGYPYPLSESAFPRFVLQEMAISYTYGREGMWGEVMLTLEAEVDGPKAVATEAPL